MTALLDVAELRVAYPTRAGETVAVAGVSFALARGEVVALVGESGSGKSSIGLSLMGLTRSANARVSGAAALEGQDLLGAPERDLRRLRGRRMAMVFQDPLSALNPVRRIGWQISEQIRAHEPITSPARAWERAIELLQEAGIPDAASRVRAYPHELSGGQRQRAMLAMALSCGPGLLIADEPTTALDVTTQAQILARLLKLRAERELGVLLITHDLGVVAQIADRVLVLKGGLLVEEGATQTVLGAPTHEHTRALLEAHTPRPARTPRAPGPELLAARGLSVRYRAHKRKNGQHIHALTDVSLALHEGETLAVVGESGAGKTTLIRCLLALQRPAAGTVAFRGKDIASAPHAAPAPAPAPVRLRSGAHRRALAPLRREVQMVFQDSSASLNPRRRVQAILATGLQLRGVPRAEHEGRATELLGRVGLPAEHLRRFPHELSGGERQRVGIARALSCEPRALVLDEPVSSLDATVRARVLELLVGLQVQSGLSYLLVTHDLNVVRGVADRVAVMLAGRVVELASTEELFARPRHEYTRALLAAAAVGDLGARQVRSAA